MYPALNVLFPTSIIFYPAQCGVGVHPAIGLNFPHCRLKSSLVLFNSLARSKAPNNSSRGILCLFIGVTQVLDATRQTSMLSSGLAVVLKYTTAAYAFSDASLNPCNSKEALGISCVE